SEGMTIFRTAKFPTAEIEFASDVSTSLEGQSIFGTIPQSWGFFPWGEGVWGGTVRSIAPTPNRFYVPQDKQYASQLNVRLTLRSGYADWQLEGIAVSWNEISEEVA